MLFLAGAGILAAGYYFKIYKPKHGFVEEDEYEEDAETVDDEFDDLTPAGDE